MRSVLLLWAGRDRKRQLGLGQVTPISLLGVRDSSSLGPAATFESAVGNPSALFIEFSRLPDPVQHWRIGRLLRLADACTLDTVSGCASWAERGATRQSAAAPKSRCAPRSAS